MKNEIYPVRKYRHPGGEENNKCASTKTDFNIPFEHSNGDYWLALSLIKGIGNKTLHRIYTENQSHNINIRNIGTLSEIELSKLYSLKPHQTSAILNINNKINSLTPLINALHDNNVQIVAFDSPEYPQKIKNIEEPPFLIFYYGNLNLIDEELIAIMGSRDISNHGLVTAFEITNALLDYNKVIIRGETFDIARLGNIAATNKNGKEVVVLSNGIFSYLKGSKISNSNNLIFSFVHPELDRTAYAEKQKNIIMFALSDKVIIVESREDGIIMTSALETLKSNKRIFAVRYGNPSKNNINEKIISAGAIPISPSSSPGNLSEIIGSKKGANNLEKNRKDLGQFFTPLTVVEFMYSMIEFIWQNDNLKKPSSVSSAEPLIIDPACGEGTFLKYALDKSITEGNNLYGIDIDESVKDKWHELKIRNKMQLVIHDGLLDISESGIISRKFDLAIGNPPYGGVGLRELAGLLNEMNNQAKPSKIVQEQLVEVDSVLSGQAGAVKEEKNAYEPLTKDKKKELINLANYLSAHYELWRKGTADAVYDENDDASLFPDFKQVKPEKERVKFILEVEKQKLLGKGKEQLHLSKDELKRLITFPIEVLFLERFIQLVKPGGYIAIIVPDGILANYNLQFVRDWLFQKTIVIAIVSLPRETFKYLGTTAKTSILFLRKLKDKEEVDMERQIFMAGSEYVGVEDKNKNDLPEIVEKFKEFCKSPEAFGPKDGGR